MSCMDYQQRKQNWWVAALIIMIVVLAGLVGYTNWLRIKAEKAKQIANEQA